MYFIYINLLLLVTELKKNRDNLMVQPAAYLAEVVASNPGSHYSVFRNLCA